MHISIHISNNLKLSAGPLRDVHRTLVAHLLFYIISMIYIYSCSPVCVYMCMYIGAAYKK